MNDPFTHLAPPPMPATAVPDWLLGWIGRELAENAWFVCWFDGLKTGFLCGLILVAILIGIVMVSREAAKAFRKA